MDQSIEGIRTTLGPKSVGILQKAWWHRFFSFDSSSSEADYAGILWNAEVVSLKIINLWLVFRVSRFPEENTKKLRGEALSPASCHHSPNACGLRLSCRSFSAAACPCLPCQGYANVWEVWFVSVLSNAERFSETGASVLGWNALALFRIGLARDLRSFPLCFTRSIPPNCVANLPFNHGSPRCASYCSVMSWTSSSKKLDKLEQAAFDRKEIYMYVTYIHIHVYIYIHVYLHMGSYQNSFSQKSAIIRVCMGLFIQDSAL